MATKTRLWPDTPTHPGEILADELEARSLTLVSLAQQVQRPVNEIESILAGRAPVTADLAWDLEAALDGISARFWMSLQADYDLAIARLRRTGPQR